MGAYQSENRGVRIARTTRVEAGIADGPYRLRGAADATWAPQTYAGGQGWGRRINDSALAMARTIIPVIFLTMAFAAMYLYMDSTLPYLADAHGRWLTISHLVLPVAFLTIHLTNRRYGPSYAFAQIVATFAVCGVVVLFGSASVRHLLPAPILPSVREVASFVAAFFAAGFLSIIAFDGARGPRWWIAPLLGSLVAGLTFVAVYYPLSFAGTSTQWVDRMAINAALLCAAAVVGIIPYWFLRGVVQPLPGFGGY